MGNIVYTHNLQTGSEPIPQRRSLLTTSAEYDMMVNSGTHANGGILPQATSEETEHLYAVLEQTQQHENTDAVELDGATTAQIVRPHLLDNGGSLEDTSNGGNSQWKSRSVTLIHPSKRSLPHSSRDESFELVQIYDDVIPVRNTLQEREEEVLERLICHSNPHRKHSLPANLAIFHSSMAPQSQNCGLQTGLNSSSDKLEEIQESIPILYSDSDMKMKREACQEKKEQKDREDREEWMEALRTISTSSCPTFLSQMKGVPVLTEIDDETGGQDLTYRNIGHGTLWNDYENPTKLLNETFAVCDVNDYDDPTCLDLVSKRGKTAVTGRADGEDGLENEMLYVGHDKIC